MITILVEFTFKSEFVEEGKELLKLLGDLSLTEIGCLFYFVNEDPKNENVVILYEVFFNVEAQAEHKATKHYKDILVDKIPEMIENRTVRYLK